MTWWRCWTEHQKCTQSCPGLPFEINEQINELKATTDLVRKDTMIVALWSRQRLAIELSGGGVAHVKKGEAECLGSL